MGETNIQTNNCVRLNKCYNRERCKMWWTSREKHDELWVLSWAKKKWVGVCQMGNWENCILGRQRSTVWELPSCSVGLVWDVWATTSDEAGKVVGGWITKNLVCPRKDFTLYPEDKDSKQGSNIIRFCFRKITLAAMLRWGWSRREWKPRGSWEVSVIVV